MKQNSLLNVGYITGQLLKPENDYNTKRDNIMKTGNMRKQQKLKSDNDGYFDVFEILNNHPANTYQMGKQNKNSFNWGFLTGVLFSFLVWIALIYIFK